MHYFMHFKGIFGTFQNWDFCWMNPLFLKLIIASILIYSWYMLVNLINLGFCEQLKILGFVLNPIWGFCSIRLKLMKLACWFDVIDHSKLFSNLCNDQLVNISKNIQVVLIFFWVLVRNSMLKPILWIWTYFGFNYCLSSCIMLFNLFMHHIVLFVLFFCANLQSVLGFIFVSFSLFVVCSWSLF